MNILDIIILICLVPAIVLGIKKGFISQAVSIISLIVGVWASARFANIVGSWLAQYINASEQSLKVIAFAVILLAVMVGLFLAGKILEGLVKLVTLGWLNRLLGVIFSLGKCLLIMGLVIMFCSYINDTFHIVKPDFSEDAVLYPIVKDLSYKVFPYIKSLLTLN
jgi:membrane protein required for colicin V production